MSKALGCKRVHDDRIAGVTFEENASCNALIVNEEYAWVGNPFSAPERQKKGESQDSPFCFSGGGTGFDARDLKAPLSGAGGVNNLSRPSLAHSASASPVFRSRKKGRILRLFPFCFVCMVQGLVPFPGFGCRFRQGVADCIADRPATYRKNGSVL